jgi:hypothetical protein
MRTRATLKLEDGAELAVELEREDLDQEEIVVRRTTDAQPATRDWGEWAAQHLATAKKHPAGTTDRFLAADRDRPY